MGKKKGKRRGKDVVTVENHQNGELPIQDTVHSSRFIKRSGTTADDSAFARTGSTSSQKISHKGKHQVLDLASHRDDQSNEELLLPTLNAKTGFDVGEVIFESTPLVYVLAETERDFRCDRCLFKRPNLNPCDRCHYVSYCSTDCKELAWSNLHKYECERLKVTGEKVLDYYRYLGLIIMVLKQPESRLIADQVERYRVSFYDLEGDLSKLTEMTEKPREVYSNLSRYLGEDQMVPYPDYCIIFSKALSATVSIVTGEIKQIGTGLYLGHSVFMNSCEPAGCRTFAGPILRLTCVEKIAWCDAKLVTVNNIPVHPRGYKQMFLEDHHMCKCVKCEDPLFIDQVTKVLNRTIALEMEGELLSFIDKFRRDYLHTEEELNEIIISCEMYLSHMDGVFGKFHFLRATILGRLTEALFDAGHFLKCRVYIPEWLKVYEFYFNLLDPRLISIVYLLVQTEIFLGNRNEAKNFMIKALQLTRVCYGRDHPFCIHMISVYEHCEASNWNMGVLIKSYPRYLDDF